MKNLKSSSSPRSRRSKKVAMGFTMIELLVAMAVFMVIAGAAFALFRQNTNLFTDQQNQVGLNISLRNALAQMQADSVNAADGYYQLSSTDWPIGITINNVATGYDTLNIITAGSVPAQLPAGTCVTTTSGSATIVVPAGQTGSTYAAQFTAGREVLFINGVGNQLTTGMLTATGTSSGANVTLAYSATAATGINTAANDPLGITTQALDPSDNDQLSDQFCQATGDWVILLSTTTYTVNGSNQLTRTVSGSTPDIIADNIISFKVGASTYINTGTGGTSTSSYRYDAPAYKVNLIRSVRVSVIGRTPPNQYSGSSFANSFDGGNYKIQALSLVINPRNLTMND
jgi:Tfp pilus assembly protein PilW